MATTSSRMLELLSLLQAQRDWPAHVLADRLEVSTRTVRRDVDALRELGYTIRATKGPDGGYRLGPGEQLPPLLFDDEQAVAIAIALQVAPATGVEIEDAAQRALATVRQVMPAHVRSRLDGIRFEPVDATSRVDPVVLETVSAAIRTRQVLRFDYEGSGPQDWARRTHPHAVLLSGGFWYLIAWDVDRDDWRIFRLDRMKARPLAGPSFEPREVPGGSARGFLAARFKGMESEDRWPCVGEFILESPAREVATWIPDADIEVIDALSVRLTASSWSWTGLLALVARFDVPFHVVGPEPLREAADQLALRLSTAAGPLSSRGRT